jgi:putative membrane protein
MRNHMRLVGMIAVAAPLLAVSAPSSRLLRGSPAVVRRVFVGARRSLRRRAPRWRWHPGAVWLLHVAVLWLWHAAALYDAALRHPPVHAAEHATLLGTGVLFWSVVIGTRSAARVPPGLGVLLVFGMALQGTFLSLLLTFARTPWYAGYAGTTAPWGLDELADQQLAGVIMWVPAGMAYLAVALILLVAWIRAADPDAALTAVRGRRAAAADGSGAAGTTRSSGRSGAAAPGAASPGR